MKAKYTIDKVDGGYRITVYEYSGRSALQVRDYVRADWAAVIVLLTKIDNEIQH